MSDKNVEWTGQLTAKQWPCRLVLHMDDFPPHKFACFYFEIDS